MKIIIFISFVFYVLAEGTREAFLFYYKSKFNDRVELHPLFLFQRSLVLLSVFFLYFKDNSVLDSLLLSLSLILMFSFFHNGSYYITRNRIDGTYPRGWFANSTTSTSNIELNFTIRFLLFLIGLTIYIVS